MKTKLLALLLFGQIFSVVQAQTINFIPTTGMPKAYSVSDIKKMTFSNGNLVLTNTGTTGTFALSGNKSILFTNETLRTITNTVAKNSFYLYLNRISAVLTIANSDPSAVVTDFEITAIDGRIMKTKHNINKNEEQVVVYDLPSGVYICRITSNQQAQTIKFLKR